MAHRMNINQFGRPNHPQEPARGYNDSMMQYGKQQEQYNGSVGFEWKEPPSWADVQMSGDRVFQPSQNPRMFYEQQIKMHSPQPWVVAQPLSQEGGEKNDVFSSMSHWGPPPGQRYQPKYRPQPPPPPPLVQSDQANDDDVFANIGEWNGDTPSQTSPMSIDLMATTPFPTFNDQYANRRTASLESPTTSSTSTEEKNSWKTLEAFLNPKTSRSPSVTEESDFFSFPVDSNGLWNSNLHNY